MNDILVKLISESRRAKTSFVPQLSDEDVASVWTVVSEFIERQMILRKGVTIQGLGVFSFAVKTIDVGSNRSIAIQRPVFLLSEKFSQTHSIRYPKQHTPGQIPLLPLNYTVLANGSPFDRDTVEMCVKELLYTLSQAVVSGKVVEFPFIGIGKLVICDGRAKMKFFREFIRQLDSSGQLEGAFNHRSASCTSNLRGDASIISGSHSPRLNTASTVLPKIVESSNEDSLSLICNNNALGSIPSTPRQFMPILPESAENGVPVVSPEGDAPLKPIATTKSVNPKGPGTSKLQLSPNVASLVVGGSTPVSPLLTSTSPDTAHRKPLTAGQGRKSVSQCERTQFRPATCSQSHPMIPGQEMCYICHQRELRNVPVSFAEQKKHRELVEDKMLQEYLQKKDSLEIAQEQIIKLTHRNESKKVAAFNLSVADHKLTQKHTKDEDFYPSYVFQERVVTPPKEGKQVQYCQQLDEQVMNRRVKDDSRRKVAAENDKREKVLIAKELETDHKEFMRRRTKEKKEYRDALAEQVEIRNELNSLSKTILIPDGYSSDSAMDPSGPELPAMSPSGFEAENPPLSRSTSLRQQGPRPLTLPKPTVLLPFPHTRIIHKEYKGKVKFRNNHSHFAMNPEPVQPIFGVNDMTPEKLHERRLRNRELYREQLDMVQKKQYLSQNKAERARNEETDMLQRARKDLIEEHRQACSYRNEIRKSLDEAWKTNVTIKRERERLEKEHEEEPSILVQQQCDKYRRCHRCKRDVKNAGESNVLAESRYISGARLMV